LDYNLPVNKKKDTLDDRLPFRSAGAALACLHALYEALVLLLLVLVLLLVLLLEPLYGGLCPRGQPYSLLDGHVGHKPEQSNLSRHVHRLGQRCVFTWRSRQVSNRYMRIGPLFNVADPGCLSRILDPNFFHPGSRIQGQKDSGSRIRILIKEFNYFNAKNCF
jgi:hypothetical protein